MPSYKYHVNIYKSNNLKTKYLISFAMNCKRNNLFLKKSRHFRGEV